MANLIYDYTIPSDTTSVTIDLSSTPIQKGELYQIIMTQVSTPVVSLYINNNQTATNYYTQELRVDSTSSVSRTNAQYIQGSPNNKAIINSYLRLTNDGYFVSLSNSSLNYGTTSRRIGFDYSTSTFTMSSITQLDIVSSTLGTGSRIQLYKVAKKVDEIEVTGSAVTSVQFTGLSIGKGNEYLLVSDVANASGSSFLTPRIYINDNQIATNYWLQRLKASNSTVDALRANNNVSGFCSTLDSMVSCCKLKLTNDGYVTIQTEDINDVGTSNVNLSNYAITSTFTVSSITQLDIVGNVTSQLDVGSRFELYKLV